MKGIEIYRNDTEDSFILLQNYDDDIINIIHSGRKGYLGFENALQVMVNFISFGSHSAPNQEVPLKNTRTSSYMYIFDFNPYP